MGQNEELRERRANAEAAHRRSLALLSERILPVVNGHKSSLSSVDTNESSGTDTDAASHSASSPEQAYYRVTPRTSQASVEGRSLSEPRRTSNVRNILN